MAAKSDKAWYWLACGVLALGITNDMANRNADLPGRLTDRAAQVVDRVTGQLADHFERVALVLGSRSVRINDRAQMALARSQAKLDCLDAQLAQHQAEFDRSQAYAQEIAITRLNMRVADRAVIVCPRQRVERDIKKIIVSDPGNI